MAHTRLLTRKTCKGGKAKVSQKFRNKRRRTNELLHKERYKRCSLVCFNDSSILSKSSGLEHLKGVL
tara:strand:+ start:204 stop:404 length:201 start_codon:yes stop_codon:yes gene_type:complete